jgi:hypothetical protein
LCRGEGGGECCHEKVVGAHFSSVISLAFAEK